METFISIDLKNAKDNFNYIKSFANKKMICVVKSDAYGHGAKILSKLYQDLGAYAFAVANIDEGIALRKNGIVKDIIILGYTPLKNAKLLAKYNLTQSLISYEYAKSLNGMAYKNNLKIKSHICLNTGMNRFGFSFKIEENFKIFEVLNFKNLSITGLYTHFCVADDKNNGLNLLQAERFDNVKDFIIKTVKDKKLFIHACNTSALFGKIYNGGDGVRIGLGLYGFGSPFLKPLLKLKTKLIHVARVSKGESVGYGGKYVFSKDGFVGVIPVGYSDGFLLKSYIKNKYFVKINNYKYPVIGEVCMNHTFIDLTQTSKTPILPKVLDEVTVLSDDSFTCFCKSSGLSAYRALTTLGNLNRKIYLK